MHMSTLRQCQCVHFHTRPLTLAVLVCPSPYTCLDSVTCQCQCVHLHAYVHTPSVSLCPFPYTCLDSVSVRMSISMRMSGPCQPVATNSLEDNMVSNATQRSHQSGEDPIKGTTINIIIFVITHHGFVEERVPKGIACSYLVRPVSGPEVNSSSPRSFSPEGHTFLAWRYLLATTRLEIAPLIIPGHSKIKNSLSHLTRPQQDLVNNGGYREGTVMATDSTVNGLYKEPLHEPRSTRMDEKTMLALDMEVMPNVCSDGQAPGLDVDEDEREHWSRGLDFILSLIGYAVGVSNLWRFPYLVLRNGGGAFLIPFFFFLLLCGIPLFYLEVCLGQFSGISSMFVWKMCPLFKGVGYGMVIVSGMACIYYNAVLSWVIYYLINSFHPNLPWSQCGHWWNTDRCIQYRGMAPAANNLTNISADAFLALGNLSGVPSLNNSLGCANWSSPTGCGQEQIKYTSAAEEFWQFNVLRKTSGLDDIGNLQIHMSMCLLAAWVLVCLCLIRGVKSLGKVVYITALLPYALLTVFLVRGLLLPGSLDGIKFYLEPDFNKLTSLTVWVEACVQVFYSLGPAWGGLITMSSFNKFHNHCIRDVLIASMADGLTSFYGGFVIFSVVGFMAREANVSVTDVATEGPGLALVAYPEAISKLPVPQIWAVLFFFMLLLLGLDSQFGQFETVVAGLMEAFPRLLRNKRVYLTFGLALFSYIVSLPIATQGGIYVFTLLDWFVSAFCVMITSLIECLVIGWIYGVDRFSDDIQLMIGKRPGLFMKSCWTVVTPGLMLCVFIFTCAKYTLPVYDGYVFPTWANAIGFFISVIPIIPIPVGMVIALKQQQGSCLQRLRASLRPASDWGPALRKYSALYSERRQEYSTKPHWFVSLVCKSRIGLALFQRASSSSRTTDQNRMSIS
ncbi:sodium- and chloride-dependent glycine transporter 1-like [Plakobranchus ocellatus]|uniref:Transporter n=1 Tax=Plakobranchus ocellatus TaxID=259542 RepID=A0AAV4CGH5_9GAST|nr:sodium- and chloride-dependent glycine transporter 1-like [Plakobranchus ocellatus]